MCLNTDQCDCPDSSFCDSEYKFISTWDLQTIKYSKLRQILSKSPNYREPLKIIFLKVLITSNFKQWNEKALAKGKKKPQNLNKQ